MSVPSQWPAKLPVKIAFVGEAPSWEEVKDGRPFTGPSGRLFNSMMRTAQLDRDEYFITNVFDEKLPDNKVKSWCVPLKVARELGCTDIPPIGTNGFLHPDHRHHLARLGLELLKAGPTVIVPLGGTALWAFTGASNITQMRGTAFPATRVVPGTKIVPTFHPSYVMKQYNHYHIVVRDLQYAAKEAEQGTTVVQAERRLLLSPTLSDIRGAMQEMQKSELLSVDIETGWGQITCIGFAWSAQDALCVPFIDHRAVNKSYWQTVEEEVEAWRLVRAICASDVPKLGQNFGGYDFMWLLYKYGIAVRNLKHDTRLLSHAIYPELPKDLGFLGSSWATQGAWKHMGKKGDKRDDQ